MKKQYLDYAGLKRVLKRLLPGARKIWHGTQAEWEALSETERDKYDQAEVIDGGGADSRTVGFINYASRTAAITLMEQGTKSYTAPRNGWFQYGNFNSVFSISVNGTVLQQTSDAYTFETFFPIKKGDIVTITSSNSQCWFYDMLD